MIRAIHHVGVNCRDMARMKSFYCEAFGFEAVDEGFGWSSDATMDHLIDVKDSAARGVMLRAGSCYLELFQYSAPPSQSPNAKRPNDPGYTHMCIDVTHIEKDIEHLKKCGMTFNDREFIDVGPVKAIYGCDPEGNVIEVLQTAPQNGFTLEELKETGRNLSNCTGSVPSVNPERVGEQRPSGRRQKLRPLLSGHP